jgi:hypothetical protein
LPRKGREPIPMLEESMNRCSRGLVQTIVRDNAQNHAPSEIS